MNTKGYLIVCFVVLAASVVGNFWQYSKLKDYERKPHYYPNHKPFIDKAVTLWSAHVREDKARVFDNRYAKSFRFKNEICISLALKKGVLGGSPTYCFDETTGNLVRKYDEFE